jgi:hypothetical protein
MAQMMAVHGGLWISVGLPTMAGCHLVCDGGEPMHNSPASRQVPLTGKVCVFIKINFQQGAIMSLDLTKCLLGRIFFF